MSLTLISFASRQIWPQVLSVLHYKPQHLLLFHTSEEHESKGPARRLLEFFRSGATPQPPKVTLREISHDNYNGILQTLSTALKEFAFNGTNTFVNLTGGNKLMSLAAAEFCRTTGLPCFYLERNFRIFKFRVAQQKLTPDGVFNLDAHLARDINPLALLRCQMNASNIASVGQCLTLTEAGKGLSDQQTQAVWKIHQDLQSWLPKYLKWDVELKKPNLQPQWGDALEYFTALALLCLGVPMVQRGIHLQPGVKHGSDKEESELDLVFNWEGKLWVVDCKERKTPQKRVDLLRRVIQKQCQPTPELNNQLNHIENELTEKELKPLKEDLLAVWEVGGLLGKALVVRATPLPAEALEFAQSRNVDVVYAENLVASLRAKLFPHAPPSLDDLRHLTLARTRATA